MATKSGKPAPALLNQTRAVDLRRLVERSGAADAHIMEQEGEAVRIGLGLPPI